MFIIKVIPLSRSKITDELSYFTAKEVPKGAIVSVPVRSKNISALVTAIDPAETQKASIKKAGFVIKKLGRIKASLFFPEYFLESAKILSEYYASTMGSVIFALLSNEILENANKIAAPLPRQDTLDIRTETNGASTMNSHIIGAVTTKKEHIYAVSGDDIDRMGSWRSLVRQEFARKKSLVIYAPTSDEAARIYSSLEKGIEDYIFLLNTSITTKKLLETWQKVRQTDHPVLVIATPQFSLIPRDDIGSTIIERENSRDWISRRAPYIDMRHAIEEISKRAGRNIYLSDCLLRTETLHRLSEHELNEGSPFKWRSISTARDQTIDMREPRNSDDKVERAGESKREFSTISDQLADLIRENQESSSHLFIYNLRRGLSPTTICGDCQSVVTCKQCSTPVVLHTSRESGRNFFMCHKCGERRSAEETCAHCSSWKLTTLGIGIDRVYADIKKLFPAMDIFQIDSDSAKTSRQISETMQKFIEKPGSILLGTEMTLPHLPEKIDHIAITSVDSLLSLPDFRMQEKIMHTITRLRASAARTILLQTRIPTEKVFEYAMKGNISDFYRMTIENREQYRYPPFKILIKITIEGKKDDIASLMGEIQESILPYHIDVFPAFTSTIKGASLIHGLIKIDKNGWPETTLLSSLLALPPSVSIKVSPESLL